MFIWCRKSLLLDKSPMNKTNLNKNPAGHNSPVDKTAFARAKCGLTHW